MRKISYRWLVADAFFSISCLAAICLIIFCFDMIRIRSEKTESEIKVLKVTVNHDITYGLFDFGPLKPDVCDTLDPYAPGCQVYADTFFGNVALLLSMVISLAF